ncbi:MAG: glutamate racemase [Chloroflexi bacterium]|nr:glutamate racemase [Chloroflexota bacterium]
MTFPEILPKATGAIGMFDSGVGGLSVARAVMARLPGESLLYVADSAHCPYGARSEAEIRALSEGITRFMLAAGAKVIVVACNTASAAALSYLRQTFPQVPFVGMVPAVKPAVQLTRDGVVGVMATPVTFGGRLYEEVVEHYGRGVRVISQTCPGLVERIEAGDLETPDTLALLRSYLDPLLGAGADTLVLGCTHYPFLIPAIRRLVGDSVQILEPSEAIARQTERVLGQRGLLGQPGNAATARFFTTGDAPSMARALRQLLGLENGDVARLQWREGVLGE